MKKGKSNKQLKELAAERLEKIKYIQADFDNYRKNMEKEKARIIELANEDLMKNIIVILDDFEMAIKAEKSAKTREVLEMFRKKLSDILERYGLKAIDSLGKKFDTEFHEAISVELSDKDSGIVTEEFQKGFMLKSKVIRHSKVKIAKKSLKESG